MVLPIIVPQVLHLKFKTRKIFSMFPPDIDNTGSHSEPPSELASKGPTWQDTRPPRLIIAKESALEKAMRNYADRAKPSISRAVSMDSFCS